jgi:hypothetical protein
MGRITEFFLFTCSSALNDLPYAVFYLSACYFRKFATRAAAGSECAVGNLFFFFFLIGSTLMRCGFHAIPHHFLYETKLL